MNRAALFPRHQFHVWLSTLALGFTAGATALVMSAFMPAVSAALAVLGALALMVVAIAVWVAPRRALGALFTATPARQNAVAVLLAPGE